MMKAADFRREVVGEAERRFWSQRDPDLIRQADIMKLRFLKFQYLYDVVKIDNEIPTTQRHWLYDEIGRNCPSKCIDHVFRCKDRFGNLFTISMPYRSWDPEQALKELNDCLKDKKYRGKCYRAIYMGDGFWHDRTIILGIFPIPPEKNELGDELKPCPFCGKKPASMLVGDVRHYRIRCEYCGIMTDAEDRETVIKTWNRRVE